MLEQFRSIINNVTTTTMTEYMRANTDNDAPTDPFEDTPFTRIPPAEGIKDEWVETILTEANKIRKTAQRNGEIQSDDAVIDSLSKPSGDLWIDKTGFYINRVGPVAQTCDSLEWTAAYTMDLDDAPHYKSDEFVDAASELRVPDSRALQSVPKFIKGAYRVLYEHTKETGRPMHPLQIQSEVNVVLSDRGYSQAYRYLDELPGVEPPTDGGAWAYIEQNTATTGEQSHV
jgi:hypothetical protein